MAISPWFWRLVTSHKPLVDLNALVGSKLSIKAPPLMVIAFASVMPRAQMLVVSGCIITSILRVAWGGALPPRFPIAVLLLRLNRREMVFRRSLSSLLLDARNNPFVPATPVERIRYHWLPLLSTPMVPVSTVTQPQMAALPSGCGVVPEIPDKVTVGDVEVVTR